MVEEELVRVLLIVEVVCVVVLSPVVLVLSVATQVKLDATLLVREILIAFPLQIVAAVVLVITGAGFTVTVTVWAVPAHPPGFDVGVTV